jgi:hypothetical protein
MCDKSPSASETNNESPYSSLNPKQLDEAAQRALDYYLGPKPETKKKPTSTQLFAVVDGIDTECLLANLSEPWPQPTQPSATWPSNSKARDGMSHWECNS